jgi:lambda family phage portal protein
MYPHHPGDGHQWNESNELRRIPAEEVIHLYRPTRAGQLRGIPDWASVMVRMFHVDSLDDAVLERQKIANLFAGFYTQTPGPEDPNSPNEGATTDTDADGTPLVGLEPGTMQELPPGMEAHFSQPPAPGNDYGDFLRGHLQAIAARVGVPYEVLTGDLRNVSDRALRLILNEFRRGLEMRQWLFFIPQFCQRIRIAWFDRAVLSSALDVADYATQRAELTQTLWVPQGWPYSHPVQDVASDVKAIRAGLQSRSSTILGRGDDPEQVDAEIAEDDKRAEGYGLVLESNAKHVSNAGVTQARPEGTTLPNGDSVANTDEE